MRDGLSEELRNIDDSIFLKRGNRPRFNAIFVEIARRRYGFSSNEFELPAEHFLKNMLPNLSTFQRSVTKERARRDRNRKVSSGSKVEV